MSTLFRSRNGLRFEPGFMPRPVDKRQGDRAGGVRAAEVHRWTRAAQKVEVPLGRAPATSPRARRPCWSKRRRVGRAPGGTSTPPAITSGGRRTRTSASAGSWTSPARRRTSWSCCGARSSPGKESRSRVGSYARTSWRSPGTKNARSTRSSAGCSPRRSARCSSGSRHWSGIGREQWISGDGRPGRRGKKISP